jgi:hypothetical protein
MHASRRVVIGAAAAASLARGLVNGDSDAGLRQPDGCGQTGKPGADDVDVSDHQMMP